jgi:type IV secretory pathway VirJ component
MKKIIWLTLLSTPFLYISAAAAQDFPVKEWTTSSQDKPLIFYLSGDGGLNKFSNSLCEGINKKGFDVISLNSKSYFWDKKTPKQTTIDINNYLVKKMAERKNQQVIMIGYSFGADVLPFILNRLPKDLHDKILVSYLMAPSESTDFEIHWSDIFGGHTKRSMDVLTELNKLVNDKIVIISASDDGHLPLNKISLKRYTHEVLPGGHHFDGDTDEIVKVILNDMD